MSTDPRIQQALQFIRDGNKAEASRLLATLINEDRTNPNLWYMAAFATDNNAKRLSAVKRALAIDPTHAKARTLLAKLQPNDDLDALLTSEPIGVPLEVQQARAKSYTNAVVICVVLYFVLWIPGLIANNIYYSEGRRMEEIAGQDLPGVRALWSLRALMITMLALAIILYTGLFIVLNIIHL